MYTFVPIKDEKTRAAAFHVYEQNPDYYRAIGAPIASTDTVLEDENAMPSGVDRKAKHYWLIMSGEETVGVIDLIESYPDKATIYVGLLQIADRGKGHGAAVIQQLSDAFKQHGFRHMELAVVLGNDDAFAFWQAQGFKSVRGVNAKISAGNERAVLIMRKEL